MRRTIARLLIFAVLAVAVLGLLSGGSANAEICKIEKGPHVCVDQNGVGVLVQVSGRDALISVGLLYADGLTTGANAIGKMAHEFGIFLICIDGVVNLYTNAGGPVSEGDFTPLGIPCPTP